jgi:hypothetical protein
VDKKKIKGLNLLTWPPRYNPSGLLWRTLSFHRKENATGFRKNLPFPSTAS